MRYQFGDVVLVPFPFTDQSTTKQRPGVIAQQTLAHYEVGRLRMPVSLLPKLTELFGVPGDELLGLNAARAGKRGPVPKLQQQIERLQRLPKAKQKLVMDMLEGVLMQHR